MLIYTRLNVLTGAAVANPLCLLHGKVAVAGIFY
jgi:hypothetical protein